VGTNTNGTGCTPAVSAGVQVVDPIKGKYTMPPPGACDYTNVKYNNDPTGTTTRHISPGTYCGGIEIGGNSTNVVFDAGTYILLGGGLKVTGSVTITGDGVTFFNTFDQSHNYQEVSINGSGLVTLRAPTTGSYKALLFYQDPRVAPASNNGSTIAGSANSVYDGIVYFPSTDLEYGGNSSSTVGGTDGYTILIGWNMTVRGTSDINTNYATIGGISPIQVAQFTE
jgi:hypothetical protein